MTIRRAKHPAFTHTVRISRVLLAVATFMTGTALSQPAFAQICCHTARCPECPAGQMIIEDVYRNVASAANCTPYTASNPNQVLQSRQQVAMSFCSTLPNCDAQTVNWSVAGQDCSGSAGQTNDGESESVANVTSGVSGAAEFQCANGAFTLISGTCNNVVGAGCAAQTVTWDQDGHVCTAQLSALTNGGNSTVNDAVNPTTGSANFVCTDGAVMAQSGATCTGPAAPPPTNNCMSTSTSWTVGMNSCTTNIPDMTHGTALTVYDNAAPTTGSAMMTCNNGMYSRSAESCVSTSPPVCPPPPPPPSPPVAITAGCLIDTPWWDVATTPDCETPPNTCTTTDAIGFSVGTHINSGLDTYYFQDPERFTIAWTGACTGDASTCNAVPMVNGTHAATVTVTDKQTGEVTVRNVTARKRTVRRINLNECPEQL
ncbi:MAG: hypothetical protein V4621_05010 [Pseudomonadota bacterium]